MFDGARDLDPRAGGAPSVLGPARGGAFASGSVPMGAFDVTLAAARNDPQASRSGTFLRSDRTTLAVSQPLGVADGDLVAEQVVVTDRAAGERGGVATATSRHALSGERPLIVEADYAVPVLRGRAAPSALGSVDAARGDAQGGLALRARFWGGRSRGES